MSINRFDKYKKEQPTEAELAAPKFQSDFTRPLLQRLWAYYLWRVISLVLASASFIWYGYWASRADMVARDPYPEMFVEINRYTGSPFNHYFVALCGILLLALAFSPLGLRGLALLPSPWPAVIVAYWGALLVFLALKLTEHVIDFEAPSLLRVLFYPYVLVALGLSAMELRSLEEEVSQ